MVYTNLNRELIQRAKSTGVSRMIYIPFITLVVKWCISSGDEWTVDRLKAIKLDIIRKKAGLSPVSSWIAKSHLNDVMFKGVVGSLERWMFSHPNRFSKGLQLLQVYTYFYSDRLTLKQKEKFVKAVSSPAPFIDKKIILRLRKSMRCLSIPKMKGELPSPDPIEFFQPSPNRRAPVLSGSVPEDQGVIDSIGYLIRSYIGQMHYFRYKDLYDPLIGNVLPMLKGKVLGQSPYSDKGDKTLTVGRIGLIQEAGYKLRAIANPGRVFQLVLQPLGKHLYQLLSHLPWDCTFDQSKAFPFVQEALQLGHEVSSIDLSNATDYFPLDLQIKVLKYLLPDSKYPSLFKEIATSKWIFPNNGDIQWRRGQPLGLFPSFALFAITHGLLLFSLLNCPYSGQFFVLGDDVVILDTELAQRYRDILSQLRCPISESKSISSASLSEFAGKIISPEKVISQLKWRNISDESFIDISRSIGPRIRPLLRKRQLCVIDTIANVPEFFGGLGWNEKGISLSNRLPLWIFSEGADSPRLTGYLRVVMKNFYSSKLLQDVIIPHDFIYEYNDALDQRATFLIRKYLGETFVPLKDILGMNLDRILDSLVDLPIQGVLGTYRSTLQKMERRLGIRHLASTTN